MGHIACRHRILIAPLTFSAALGWDLAAPGGDRGAGRKGVRGREEAGDWGDIGRARSDWHVQGGKGMGKGMEGATRRGYDEDEHLGIFFTIFIFIFTPRSPSRTSLGAAWMRRAGKMARGVEERASNRCVVHVHSYIRLYDTCCHCELQLYIHTYIHTCTVPRAARHCAQSTPSNQSTQSW